jgi:hypothetical protein
MNSSTITSPDHTPGPWIVCESLRRGFCIRSARGGFIAWTATGSDRRDAANAQLMSAAPTLLLALKAVLTVMPNKCLDSEIFALLDRCALVVAQAEGDGSTVHRPMTAPAA